MYGYESQYDMLPATEGIGSFFESVLNKIKKFAKDIKEWMKKVALKIRRMTGNTTAAEARKDSDEATKTIAEIKSGITSILNDCCTQIDVLYNAYIKVGKRSDSTASKFNKDEGPDGTPNDGTIRHGYKTMEDNGTNKSGNTTYKYYDYEKSFKAHGGMGKVRKDASSDDMTAWNTTKEQVGEIFMKQKAAAEKISAKLKSLASFGPLTLSATKAGYSELKSIFDANGTFGNRWKRVKIAAEWSTGDIKAALNKVVSMYDVGVRATNAFGNRLASGFVRDEKGKKMNDDTDVGNGQTFKEMRSEAKGVNKIYNSNNDHTNISSKRKDESFASRQFESVNVLDRLYQMAYEDAMNDIEQSAMALEAFDDVPGAYEFVDAYDYDEYDPDFDFDLV